MIAFFDFFKRNRLQGPFRLFQPGDELLNESSTDIRFRIDPTGNLTFINRPAEKYFGCASDAVIGKNIIGTLMPETESVKKNLTNIVSEINRNEEQYFVSESGQDRKNGDNVWVLWRSKAIRDNDGHLIEISSTGSDITEGKLLKDQLFHSQKMETLGRLASSIAHDFNNMLTIINGYSERLLNRIVIPDQIRSEIEQISKAGKRAISLSQQLLNFSNAQTGETKSTDLNGIINDMEAMLHRLLGEKVELSIHFASERTKINANAGRLGQVILNLAINARDAMPQGGALTIKTANVILEEKDCIDNPYSSPGSFVCLSFEDRGVGIEQTVIDKIFEPFFSTKSPGKGTGIGLSVVKDIVNDHNGWINVISKINKGTRFDLYFPAIHDEQEEELAETESFGFFKGNGKRILIVEDEEGVRDLIIKTLEEFGYRPFAAETAKKALEIFAREEGKFDLIFSDVILPDSSGVELADTFSALNHSMKILMSSGHAEDKAKVKDIRKKGFLFIKKPYTIFELLQVIKETIESGASPAAGTGIGSPLKES